MLLREVKQNHGIQETRSEGCLERESAQPLALLNAAVNISKLKPENMSRFSKKKEFDEHDLLGFPVEWGRRYPLPIPL